MFEVKNGIYKIKFDGDKSWTTLFYVHYMDRFNGHSTELLTTEEIEEIKEISGSCSDFYLKIGFVGESLRDNNTIAKRVSFLKNNYIYIDTSVSHSLYCD